MILVTKLSCKFAIRKTLSLLGIIFKWILMSPTITSRILCPKKLHPKSVAVLFTSLNCNCQATANFIIWFNDLNFGNLGVCNMLVERSQNP